ncbi:MAG TPA: TonB-dependent receptor [Candidatus Acidoferrales bacterium]|nr:TonB-dependent receptor [Candidatus Acidoferrales bacterium]
MNIPRSKEKLARWIVYGALVLSPLVFAVSGSARERGATPQTLNSSISGRVSVASSQGVSNNLAAITVKLTGPAPATTSQDAVSDTEGRFEFSRLAPGSYKLEVTVDGFKPWSATVDLVSGQDAVQDAGLQLNLIEEQVEVKGEATEIATESVTATATVSEQQLETLPLRTGKFTEALSVSPSVIKTQEGRLNFNGQAESQGMLLVDGAENVDPVAGSFAIPVPVDAIQSIQVFNTPDSVAYGGFSAGLTRIDVKPPSPSWNYKFLDFLPSFRAKNDHLVGLANMTPRFEIGGPVLKDKVNFTEDLSYEFRKDPIHGLTWPFNETDVYAFDSFTNLQWILSPKHLVNFNLNDFASTNLYANIDSLIPQAASVNFRRRGVSFGVSDAYQFNDGLVLTTVVRYINFYTDAHGQGLEQMTINPEGWGGNYFNISSRNANQLETLPVLQLPAKSWLGKHDIRFGVDFLYRTFTGSSVSRPINLLAEGCTLAGLQAAECIPAETISFLGSGALQGSDTEVSEYAEDHWTLTKSLSLTIGGRLSSQTIGLDAAFAPRAGLAYYYASWKTIFRAGAGLIYSHVPLLAQDFDDNQTRELNFVSGPYLGRTITLQNVYLPGASIANLTSSEDVGDSPRTFTWNIESETSIRKNITLRLGYYETHTDDLFLANPILPAAGTTASNGLLALENTGSAHYRQAQATARYSPSQKGEVNVSYSWSRARGDLNTLSDTFIPYQIPVIRPNAYGVQPSDIPNRLLVWGFVHVPFWSLVFSPVVDMHSGFPYSNYDVFQNYVGAPNSLRFPTYFTLDVKVYRDFPIHIPFKERPKGKIRKIRVGVYSLDVTNRQNPHDVFSTLGSPLFGQFDGFQRRFTGLALSLGE